MAQSTQVKASGLCVDLKSVCWQPGNSRFCAATLQPALGKASRHDEQGSTYVVALVDTIGLATKVKGTA